MPDCKTLTSSVGTEEQGRRLNEAIERYSGTRGALMPILQEAQEIYGYLPEEVQIVIAEGLGISLAEVYGVVTFYSQFTLNPKGKHVISVCIGTACYVRGAGDILDKVCEIVGCQPGGCSEDGRFSVDAVRCIGACGLAPVVIIDGEVFGSLTLDQVEGIIKKFSD